MWKQGKQNLQNNETGSLRRLQNLIVKLQKPPDWLETYDNISNQLKEGIVEKDKNIPPKIPEKIMFFLINLLSEKMLRAHKYVLFMMRPHEQIINQNH